MQEFISSIPVLAGIVEKGGVIGLLLIIVAFLGWEVRRMRREINRVYGQRDYCRQVRARYRFALDANNIKVDISDIDSEMKEDKENDE